MTTLSLPLIPVNSIIFCTLLLLFTAVSCCSKYCKKTCNHICCCTISSSRTRKNSGKYWEDENDDYDKIGLPNIV